MVRDRKVSGGREVPPRSVLALSLAIPLASVLLSPAMGSADRDVERAQRCERGGVSRVVELREAPGSGLPCEVVYLKPDEDGSESALWMARNDRAFCTASFEAFVVKLETSLDWTCEAVDGASVVAVADGEGPTSAAPSVARAANAPVGADEPVPSSPVPSAAVPAPSAEPARAEPDIAAAASVVSELSSGASVRVPEPGEALPVPRDASRSNGVARVALTPFDQLRSLAPSGDYVPVAVPSVERPSDVRVAPWCPPGGRFAWKAGDQGRPVLALGESMELAVRLPDAAIDETSVLFVVSSVGEGATREVQALSPVPAAGRGQAFDLRVAPRGPGSGALAPARCRYLLEE